MFKHIYWQLLLIPICNKKTGSERVKFIKLVNDRNTITRQHNCLQSQFKKNK